MPAIDPWNARRARVPWPNQINHADSRGWWPGSPNADSRMRRPLPEWPQSHRCRPGSGRRPL